MSSRDEDRFRLRLKPPKARGSVRPTKFVDRVLQLTAKAGPTARTQRSLGRKGSGAKQGRGYVVARLLGQSASPRSRRVVVKTRLVNVKRAGLRSTQKHLQYIQREGVTREGDRGCVYSAAEDLADASRFEERGRDDRHQFRFIVSPEDAVALGDLKPFTRALMAQMEADFGTKLEWIAVDHWDTDNPHTHIVLRGKDDTGHDVVIARDYISHGMRLRAQEIATEWLGPRTEQQIRLSEAREVTAERWTHLDAEIQRYLHDGVVSLTQHELPLERRMLLRGRLEHLNSMGLATKESHDCWFVEPEAERALRAIGERGDIIRSMQQAFHGQRREYAIFDHRANAEVIGRVAAKGLQNELDERAYLIVDDIDGRAHYVPLPSHANVDDYATGAIVRLKAEGGDRAADRTIASVAKDGIYRTQDHMLDARKAAPSRDPNAFVAAHVRRLEALRRAGIVERIEEGVWRIPADLPEQGARYDRSRFRAGEPQLLSHLPIEKQVRAVGATWLDRQLVSDSNRPTEIGFGAEVRSALRQRLAFLVDEGLAHREGSRVILRGNLLAALRSKELELVGRQIASETGLAYRHAREGERISGTYRRSMMLASGRFAMLDDGVGFTLVPWRPAMERHLGLEMRGRMGRSDVAWDYSRARELGL